MDENNPAGRNIGDIGGIGCQDFEANPTITLTINRMMPRERRDIFLTAKSIKIAARVSTEVEYYQSAVPTPIKEGSVISKAFTARRSMWACQTIYTSGTNPNY